MLENIQTCVSVPRERSTWDASHGVGGESGVGCGDRGKVVRMCAVGDG